MNRLCGMGIALGAFLIWRGATGDIWRSKFTGDAVVPRWLYITCGTILIAGGIGLLLAAHWLVKSQY